MSNIFNLGGFLKNVFAKKKQKTKDVSQQIETKLTDKNKKEDEQVQITESQLEKDRKDTEETTIEKKLEKVRAGSNEMLVEGQLDKSKSKIMKHRNAETAVGNINKLEEQRVKRKDKFENEKQEPSSETDKPKRFLDNTSPDGLRLANNIKIADIEDFDIDLPGYEDQQEKYEQLERNVRENPEQMIREIERPYKEDELSPEVMEELKKFNIEEPSEEEMAMVSEDLVSDPEFLNDTFQENVVGTSSETGTPIEERKIIFDLRNEDGTITEAFKKGKFLDSKQVEKALMNFIRINHPEENINKDAVHIDIDKSNLTGTATYIVPKGQTTIETPVEAPAVA